MQTAADTASTIRASARKPLGMRTAVKIVITVILSAFAILMMIPLLWMLSTSFKINGEVFKYPIDWIPKTWHWENYQKVWTGPNAFGIYYVNSIKITVITVAGNVLTSAMAGFAFAKLRFKAREFLFLVYLSTMMIPAQVLLLPRFIMFDHMHLINTQWSLILPGMFTVFGTFLLRQFFSTLPNELLEAARVDGAGFWRMFWQIALPLSKPALVTVMIITFNWHWNDYESPLIFLRDRQLFTIPLGLTTYVEEIGTNYVLSMAASVSSFIPLLVVVIIAQRFFVEGIANSGLKG